MSEQVTVVVRVWMPDRPGALGQVASRIGAVRGDVLAIEILEHGAGRAIDELSVRLPDAGVLDLLAAEISAVDGVDVESIRAVDEDRADPSLAALGIAAALAESPPADRPEILCGGVQRIAEAEWAALLRNDEIVHAVGEPPAGPWLAAFIAGSEHLDGVDDIAPDDLVWAPLEATGLTLVAGRGLHPIHERERVRVSLLARLANALLPPID